MEWFEILSREELVELNKKLVNTIAIRDKEEAISLSGWVTCDSYVNVDDLSLVEDAYKVNFIKWFVKHRLGGKVGKYIHQYIDTDGTVYIFSDEKSSLTIPAGKVSAIKIHNMSVKYLMDDYLEWGWNQS